MDFILMGVGGSLLLMFSLTMPVRFRFSAAIILSVPQLYLLPVGDFYLSMALVSSLSLWPEAIKEIRSLFRQKLFVIVLGIMAIQAISLFWSSDLRLGLRTLIYTLPFLFIAAATYSIGKKNRRLVYTTLGIACVMMFFEAVLVVLFRLSPELEMAYIDSNFSGIFSNPNVITAFLDGSERNNVYDPVKSGGVFVNANIAAAYLGMGAFIAYLTAREKASRLFMIIAACLWLASFFTGSKAGIMLALALPLAALLFVYYLRYDAFSRPIISATAWMTVPVLLLCVVQMFDALAEKFSFASAAIDTASLRFLIWRYAADAFAETPVLGQGFGGWQQGYETYAIAAGIPPDFPPHNTLIYLWSQSGIIAAGLGLIFMFSVLKLSYRLAKTTNQTSRYLGLTLGLAAGWLFIHGMGENWGLLGEPHQQPLLAALIGLAYADLRSSRGSLLPGNATPVALHARVSES